MIRALRCVDEVIMYNVVAEDIKNIDFHIYVKGSDNVHEGIISTVKWCEINGKEVVTLPRTDGISSTYLRRFVVDLNKSESGDEDAER
jgi:bifunctional ADP-heptose synthase (sugar kinase/adenylyltransferase)